ncbi:MAG TPA: methyltransferase domain-containing protein [Terriglobia bacterium]|nr:methyltransferase domain-containing protein [Terriglobia bacterium]
MRPALAQRDAPLGEAGDRTGRDFWDHWWQRAPLPAPIDPLREGLKNYPFRTLHRFFAATFGGQHTRGQRLIEIGCAQSALLPYFARYFGFRVAGLDQSELGCERARRLLERERVPGDVYVADFFAPPAALRGAFDVVFSFGVIEHFDDTARAVRATAAFVRPGGTAVALIPNLTGILGRYQRLLDRELYDAHVVIGKEWLAQAHRAAGLDVVSAIYLMPAGLEVLNLESWRYRPAKWLVSRGHTAASRLVWFADDHVFHLRPNRWTSPYVVCVARQPEQV